jgi:hypothetical protein
MSETSSSAGGIAGADWMKKYEKGGKKGRK